MTEADVYEWLKVNGHKAPIRRDGHSAESLADIMVEAESMADAAEDEIVSELADDLRQYAALLLFDDFTSGEELPHGWIGRLTLVTEGVDPDVRYPGPLKDHALLSLGVIEFFADMDFEEIPQMFRRED